MLPTLFAVLALGTDPAPATQADLAKLQGIWKLAAMEANGAKVAIDALQGANIVVTGTAFSAMGGVSKGTFTFDATRTPKTLDVNYTDGPEKGATSLGIYKLDGDTWTICIGAAGGTERPKEFASKAGSGHYLETFRREAAAAGGDAVQKELAQLEGEWAMVSAEQGGQQVPEAMRKDWKRVAKGNTTTVTFGGQTVLQAAFAIDPAKSPKTIDYTLTGGPNQGKKQLGIYELTGDTVRFCFAAPGADRPTAFATKAGDGLTFSVWKRVKP